jgi:hypothetical protein
MLKKTYILFINFSFKTPYLRIGRKRGWMKKGGRRSKQLLIGFKEKRR